MVARLALSPRRSFGALVAVLVLATALVVTESPPAVSAPGNAAPAVDEINGAVWLDVNADGVNDAAEPGFDGATVTLRDPADTVVGGPVTTGVDGFFSFVGLDPADGPFRVRVETPVHRTITDGGGGDNDILRAGAANVGQSAPVPPQTTVDAGVRPQWTVDLGTWGNGPLTGSAPFDTGDPLCPDGRAPGNDCSQTDDVVRAQDVVNFLWSVSASNPEAAQFAPLSDVVFEQTLVPAPGASIEVPTLPSVCNSATGGGTAPPTSRITTNGDGSITIVCNMGTWDTSGESVLFNLDVEVRPSVNGSTFTSTARAYAAEIEVTGGDGSTPPATTPNAVPSPDVVDTIEISAGFAYDLNKDYRTTSGTVYYNHDGVTSRRAVGW